MDYMDNPLERMNMALSYIIECKHLPELTNCGGQQLKIGVDIDTIFFISNLSMFLGKAQVYSDQANQEFLEDMVGAFWNKYDEDFDSYYINKSLSDE